MHIVTNNLRKLFVFYQINNKNKFDNKIIINKINV